MHCDVCNKDVHPSIDISESGAPVYQCPSCMRPMGSALATKQTVASHADIIAGKIDTHAVQFIREPKPKAGNDLLEAARARLKELDAELARLEGLQRVRRRIAAMIAAAEAVDADENDQAARAAAE